MQIKLHGRFAEDYPGEYDIQGDTIAEVVEGWSRQVGFYADLPYDQRPIVRIVGCDDVDFLLAESEQKEIHLVPAMMGGGGKWGSILLGAALIGLSLIPGGQVGTLLLGKFATAVMSAGIGMVLAGAMAFFNKAPTLTRTDDPEASKYLGLNDNTTAIGTPIPISYGEQPRYGHVLALNVDSSNMLSGAFPANPT